MLQKRIAKELELATFCENWNGEESREEARNEPARTRREMVLTTEDVTKTQENQLLRSTSLEGGRLGRKAIQVASSK